MICAQQKIYCRIQKQNVRRGAYYISAVYDYYRPILLLNMSNFYYFIVKIIANTHRLLVPNRKFTIVMTHNKT